MGAERARVRGFGRLEDGLRQAGDWYPWGPYVSERQWGTVREDYSADGDAWDYLPHDHARSRAYRWGEDGLAGYHQFYGDEVTVEYPAGSGKQVTLDVVAADLRERLISIFRVGVDGRRPCFGGAERMQADPAWKDNLIFRAAAPWPPRRPGPPSATPFRR
jgi:hypothetical protein